MTPLICKACKCDITVAGFICEKRLCPLDEFTPAGHIELDNTPAPRKKPAVKRYFIPTASQQHTQQGGPAPSDSLKRYE